MGSWRPVLAVWIAAAACWAAVALECGAAPAPAADTRRLAPELSGAAIVAIDVDGEPLRRGQGGAFVVGDVPADPEVVDRLLAALEHTWVRRFVAGAGDSAELGLADPRAELRVTTEDGAAVALRRGTALADRDLVWVGTGADAALITAAEADQLFPPRDRLRLRRLIAAVVDEIELLAIDTGEDTVEITGDPLEVAVAGGRARADAAALTELLEGLGDLELEAGEPGGEAPPLAIRLTSATGAASIEVRGGCGREKLAVATHLGDGCVAAAPLERARAARRLALVERRLVDPARRPRRAVLTRGGERVIIDPGGEGRDAALEWLESFAGAAGGETRTAVEAGPAGAVVDIEYEAGDSDRLELREAAGRWWARRAGEPVALALAPGREALLEAEAIWFLDRDLVRRDPGEVIAVRQGGRELDAAQLAPALAQLEALRWVAAAPRPEHRLAPPRARIEVRFSPPPVATGDPDRVELWIGAPAEGGCHARLARDPAVFVLAEPLCAGLLR